MPQAAADSRDEVLLAPEGPEPVLLEHPCYQIIAALVFETQSLDEGAHD
jgi:hypothetical protein